MQFNLNHCKTDTFPYSESTQSTIDDSEPETLQEETRLDPLSLQLAEAGSITLAVAAFFKEMHSVGTAKVGPVNPGKILFSHIFFHKSAHL